MLLKTEAIDSSADTETEKQKLTSPTHFDTSDMSALPPENSKEPSERSNSCTNINKANIKEKTADQHSEAMIVKDLSQPNITYLSKLRIAKRVKVG